MHSPTSNIRSSRDEPRSREHREDRSKGEEARHETNDRNEAGQHSVGHPMLGESDELDNIVVERTSQNAGDNYPSYEDAREDQYSRPSRSSSGLVGIARTVIHTLWGSSTNNGRTFESHPDHLMADGTRSAVEAGSDMRATRERVSDRHYSRRAADAQHAPRDSSDGAAYLVAGQRSDDRVPHARDRSVARGPTTGRDEERTQPRLQQERAPRSDIDRLRNERNVLRESYRNLRTYHDAILHEKTHFETQARALSQEIQSYQETIRGLQHTLHQRNAEINALQQELEPHRIREREIAQPSLDAFDTSLDQVSEAQVKSGGPVSVEGINDAVDTLVNDLLERVSSTDLPRAPPGLSSEPGQDASTDTVLQLLGRSDVEEEARDLLLDGYLHTKLVRLIHALFFASQVSVIVGEEGSDQVDKLLDVLSKQQSWKISQRWRALAATASAAQEDPSLLEDLASRIAKGFISSIGRRYNLPPTAMDTVVDTADLQKNVLAILGRARELSLILKRDVLSVRLSVVCGLDAPGVYDSKTCEAVWADMGVRSGDQIVGPYALGLVRCDESGRATFVARPKVVTEALLRYAQPKP